MGTIVRPHPYPDGAVARPDHANVNETTIYNEFNGNIDWENLKAALQNAANGLVKLDASAKVPVAQLPTTIPSGVIVMWSGTLGTIPAGWSLCDGTGETPDLRGKFIYGWLDGVDPGGTGGSVTHTHTYSDVPTHNHTTASDGVHTHACGGTWQDTPTDTVPKVDSTIRNTSWSTDAAGAHTHSISNTGIAAPETDAGSTLPPYFKLAFIQKD